MILFFLIVISLLQFALYFLNNKYKNKVPDFVIFLLVLACYFFIFPRLFYPEPRTDGINCGMPILGIILGFWIFGTIAGIATHLIWKLKKRKTQQNL
ncbi:MAG: hypothetical protein COA50_09155 [Flavobacteriaceae bacterium]|nr:MAG: hypothetical protein COA50_09155 [Flavobacteriaceae bacterium]